MERLARDGLARARAEPGPQSRRLAEALDLLATAMHRKGKPDEAEPLFREALELRLARLPPDDPDLAESYNNLGFVLSAQGRNNESEPFYRRALDHRLKTLGAGDSSTGVSYSNLGALLYRMGKFEEAGQPLARAVEILRATLGNRDLVTASAIENLANQLDMTGEPYRAETLTREALAIQIAVLGENHPAVIGTYNNLGYALAQQDRQEEAEPFILKGVKIATNAFPDGHPGTVQILLNAARFLATIGRLDEAERLAGEAVRIDGLLADNPARVTGASGTGVRDAAALQRAGGTMQVHSAYVEIAAQLALAQPKRAETLRERIFLSGQMLTNTTSAEAMAMSVARQAERSGALGGLIARQQMLARRAIELDAALMLSYLNKDQVAPAQSRAELQSVRAALQRTSVEIDRLFPSYRALIAPDPIGFDKARSLLARDEGVLLYFVAGQDLYAVGLGPEKAVARRLRRGSLDSDKRVDELRCQVDSETCARRERAALATLGIEGEDEDPNRGRFDLRTSYELYRDIVAPVEGALAGVKRLYVVTAGPLGDLPLGLLTTSEPPPGGETGDSASLASAEWLADRYAITRLPSVQSLSLRKRGAARAGGVVAFAGYGDPALCGTEGGPGCDPSNAALFLQQPAPNAAMVDRDALRRLGSLPGTRTELAALAGMFPQGMSTVRVADAATEHQVRNDPGLGRARVVAFATHGLLPGSFEGLEEPGLVLTPGGAVSTDDGLLSASEVAALSLAADWVILSACNTATARDGAGDGLSGLSRAFLFAGAQALLASHWRVDDTATAMLTVETLRAMEATPSLTRGQALQLAMRAVRTGKRVDGSALVEWNPAFAHPSYWAPFSHISFSDEPGRLR